ncbi:MAG: type II secretion system protein GspD, partial [Alkalimonas sp.]|nr:type II secretion system protein GspD [Alkalimonas sp.]
VFIRASIVRDGATMSEMSQRKYNYIRAEQLERDQRGIQLMPRTPQAVLPEWDDSLILPPTFDEYLQQQERKQD